MTINRTTQPEGERMTSERTAEFTQAARELRRRIDDRYFAIEDDDSLLRDLLAFFEKYFPEDSE